MSLDDKELSKAGGRSQNWEFVRAQEMLEGFPKRPLVYLIPLTRNGAREAKGLLFLVVV